MPRSIGYAPAAIADLDHVYWWQTQAGSGPVAKRKVMAIRTAIRRLKQLPCLFPTGDEPGSREMPCVGHRVIYQVTPDTGHNATAGDVLILRIFGPGQSRA